jgi:hypothetical protein
MTALFTLGGSIVPDRFQNSRRRGIRHHHIRIESTPRVWYSSTKFRMHVLNLVHVDSIDLVIRYLLRSSTVYTQPCTPTKFSMKFSRWRVAYIIVKHGLTWSFKF